MITYLYWTLILGLAAAAVFLLGSRLDSWKGALIGAAAIVVIGWTAYFFYFQQVFVKRWGGVMRIAVPEGQRHITATWKDDNLWVENYDPASGNCIFTEYSKGNLLEGKVIIRNCNPIAYTQAPQ